jgi:hypothetical protein
MRLLPSPPETFLDARTGAPNHGSFRGGLPPVTLGALQRGSLARIRREKRWMWIGIANDELILGLAVVRLGYAANAFAFALDRKAKRLVADETSLGPPFAASVGDRAGEGCQVRYQLGATRVSIERAARSSVYVVDARMGELAVSARLEAAEAPPALGVIADLGEGFCNSTEKRALLRASGEVSAGRQRFSLDGALAGYDFTAGLLHRHTAWRWAYALGHAQDGRPIAFNLTEGFVGERECVAWVDGDLVALEPAHFTFAHERPLERWGVRVGESQLAFDPGGMHREAHNLAITRARFLQLPGAWQGRIAIPGKEAVVFEGLPGIAEDQDVMW